jgi:hypothetical protein
MSGHRIVRGGVAVIAALPLLLVGAGTGARGDTAAQSRPSAIPRFDRHHFTHPAHVDNPWLPMRPGMRYVLRGRTAEGPHRVVFTVTDLTKVVDGVRSVVAWDRDYSAGKLVEAELAFFAQDDAGVVWAVGEYPEEYENGRLTGAPDTWIAGLRAARPGIAMLAHPRVGMTYSQGLAPAIEFADRARVLRTRAHACVPIGCFRRMVVTDEWDALDPSGGHQRKSYVAGLGNVRVGAVGGDGEVLGLTRVERLCGHALRVARERALRMDRRGHRVSAVYRHTPAAERRRHTVTC